MGTPGSSFSSGIECDKNQLSSLIQWGARAVSRPTAELICLSVGNRRHALVYVKGDFLKTRKLSHIVHRLHLCHICHYCCARIASKGANSYWKKRLGTNPWWGSPLHTGTDPWLGHLVNTLKVAWSDRTVKAQFQTKQMLMFFYITLRMLSLYSELPIYIELINIT